MFLRVSDDHWINTDMIVEIMTFDLSDRITVYVGTAASEGSADSVAAQTLSLDDQESQALLKWLEYNAVDIRLIEEEEQAT